MLEIWNLQIEEDNNVTLSEMSSIIRRVAKGILENHKPSIIAEREGSKAITRKKHVLKFDKKIKSRTLSKHNLTKKAITERNFNAYENLYKKLEKMRDICIALARGRRAKAEV